MVIPGEEFKNAEDADVFISTISRCPWWCTNPHNFPELLKAPVAGRSAVGVLSSLKLKDLGDHLTDLQWFSIICFSFSAASKFLNMAKVDLLSQEAKEEIERLYQCINDIRSHLEKPDIPNEEEPKKANDPIEEDPKKAKDSARTPKRNERVIRFEENIQAPKRTAREVDDLLDSPSKRCVFILHSVYRTFNFLKTLRTRLQTKKASSPIKNRSKAIKRK